ncbi:glutathione S-transferase [Pavlovales sp. CCMP2436]|nr:glutathione S-transferase [Pavlovales sp. CCMP2436]
MALKIFGVPLSQPVRAVVWQCLVKRVPFTFEMVVPGASGKMGTKGPEFRAKFPLGTVPAIEDGDLHLSESVAIMSYIADKFSLHGLYPTDLAARARVHEYMAWSHRNTRNASAKVFGPFVRADLRPSGSTWLEDGLKSVDASCTTIDGFWLSCTPFLAGQTPTIADFSCYEELVQLAPDYGAVMDFSKYGNLHKWMGQMASLPHHDEVHAVLKELGPLEGLLSLDAKGVGAKLMASTKTGMLGIKTAVAANEKAAPIAV